MKIAIDLTPLYGRKRTGVEMYAIDLYRAFLPTGHQIIPIFHVQNELDDNPNAVIIPESNRLLLENIKLSKCIRKIAPDIVLFPIFPPPVDLKWGFKGEVYPTYHDCAFLKFRKTLNFAAKYYLTPKVLWAMKWVNGIITISETEKHQFAKYTNKPIYNLGENIAIGFKGASQKANLKLLEKWDLRPESYFISVSTIEPRKNFKYLLKVISPILKDRKMKLVLVGRKGWGQDEELQLLIDQMKDYLIFTNYVSEEELISLYHYAYAFALLSLDEGFGRTPFEAVACGCKHIILSNIEIFHETFDDNATFLPLHDENEARRILREGKIIETSNDFKIPFHVMEERIKILLK